MSIQQPPVDEPAVTAMHISVVTRLQDGQVESAIAGVAYDLPKVGQLAGRCLRDTPDAMFALIRAVPMNVPLPVARTNGDLVAWGELDPVTGEVVWHHLQPPWPEVDLGGGPDTQAAPAGGVR